VIAGVVEVIYQYFAHLSTENQPKAYFFHTPTHRPQEFGQAPPLLKGVGKCADNLNDNREDIHGQLYND
jgi:hypothetical protein